MLAQVYDAFDGERSDLDAYVDLVKDLRVGRVLDLGCGTGSLPVRLAAEGVRVIGVDPAAASLNVARAKDREGAVTWVEGDATTLPAVEVDLVTMTGNVAQVFLTDDEWDSALQGVAGVLAPGGWLVFETRRPDRRAWEDWARSAQPEVRDVAGVGQVEQRFELTEVAPPFVSFRYTYLFARDGSEFSSDSTLRFRSREEIEQSLSSNGYTTTEVREAPDRPGREYVFVAQHGTPES